MVLGEVQQVQHAQGPEAGGELSDLVPGQVEGPQRSELAQGGGQPRELVPVHTQGLQFPQLAELTGQAGWGTGGGSATPTSQYLWDNTRMHSAGYCQVYAQVITGYTITSYYTEKVKTLSHRFYTLQVLMCR